MRKYLVLFLTLGLGMTCLSSNIIAEEKNDTKAPTITFKVDEVNVIKNDIEKEKKKEEKEATPVNAKTKSAEEVLEYEINVVKGSKLDLSKYLEVEDNSSVTSLTSFGKVNLEEEGSYTLIAIALDKAKNASSTKFKVNVISKEKLKKLKEEKEERLRKAEEEARLKREEERRQTMQELAKIGVNGDLNALAASMVGMPGDCYYIATLFLSSAYGDYSIDFNNPVGAGSAKPGDMIYYSDSGIGVQHYAIYLGGNIALQGNMSGVTRIDTVYLPNSSEPIFYPVYH